MQSPSREWLKIFVPTLYWIEKNHSFFLIFFYKNYFHSRKVKKFDIEYNYFGIIGDLKLSLNGICQHHLRTSKNSSLSNEDSTPTPVPEEPVPVVPEPVQEPEPVVPLVPSVPEPAPSEPEPPKPEPPKPQPPTPEPPKQEPVAPTPAPSIPKVEDLEPPKIDTAKVEPPKPDATKKEETAPKEPAKVENISPKPAVHDQNGNNSDVEVLSSTTDKEIKKETDIKAAAEEEDDEEEEVNVGLYGAVLLSLWYDSNASKISINVVKCRGLKALDVKGTSDPYVKIWLCKNGKEYKKEKTSIKKGRLSPIFNETLEFDLPDTDISEASLKISVIDDDFGGNDLIGSILLGDDSEPDETTHWKDTFLNMGASVTAWHTLRYFA